MKRNYLWIGLIALLFVVGWVMPSCVPVNGDEALEQRVASLEQKISQLEKKTICFVRLTHDQTITNDEYHKIQFDAKDVDTANGFDTTLHRWVAQEDGYYQFSAQLWLDGQPDPKIWKVKFRFNSAPNHPDHKHSWMGGIGHTIYTSPGTDSSPRVFWPVRWMSEGDHMELWVIHHSGQPATIQGTEPYQGHKTWMSVIKL